MSKADSNVLPSRFQIGESVVLPATVRSIKFNEGKVEYTVDLEEGKEILVSSDSVAPSLGVNRDGAEAGNR